MNFKEILMWTKHDFLGYGECSGLVASGYHACPICGPSINAWYSQSQKKMVYQGHEKFLPTNHPLWWGYLGRPPKTWEVSPQYDVWQESLHGFSMKSLSIFHALPYWRKLLINHLLDPMNIFKNVGQMLWEYLSRVQDNKKACDDLQKVGILYM